MADTRGKSQTGDYGQSSSTDYKQAAASAANMASDTMQSAMEKGGEMLEEGREMSLRAASTVADTVRQNPLATMAAVAVFGLAVGALWRMKQQDTYYDRMMRQVPRDWRNSDVSSWIPSVRWR